MKIIDFILSNNLFPDQSLTSFFIKDNLVSGPDCCIISFKKRVYYEAKK